MGSRSTRPVALMSIHPTFAESIITGRKRVEFRKTRMATNISHVVIYATNPIQRVIGFFTVDRVEHGNPDALWRRHQRHAGVDRELFVSYYRDRDSGIAIKVGQVTQLKKPKPLSALGDHVVPPQSFRYLPESVLGRLQR